MTKKSSIFRASLAAALVLSPALAGCDFGPSDPFAAAQEAYANGEMRVALTYVDEVLEEAPSDIDAILLQADILMALGNPERVITELEMVPTDGPQGETVKAYLADAYLAEGQFEKAQEVLANIVEPSAKSLAVEVSLLSATGKRTEANDILANALQSFPKDSRLNALDAERLWLAGKVDEARASLKTALSDEGKVAPYARLFAGRLALEDRDHEAASRHFEALLKLRPTNQTAMIGMAAIARDKGDDKSAKEWLNKTNAAGPPHPVSALIEAEMAFGAGDTQRSFEIMEGIPEEYLRQPQFSRLRGLVAAARGQKGTAIAFLEPYVEDTGGDIVARKALAEILASQDELDKAWQVISPMIDHPQSDVATLQFALKLSQATGKGNQDAIRSLISKRGQSAGLADVMKEAGEAIRAGDWAKADSIYAAHISGKGSNDPALLNNAAAVKTKLGKHTQAVALARRALAEAPQSPEIMDTLGWALWQEGKAPGEAREWLTKAREKSPNNREINKHWAIAHAKS